MTDDAMTSTDTDAVVRAVGFAAPAVSRALARGILYGEDMLRYKVFSALSKCGIDEDLVTLEHPHPNLPGNKKVDTVILRGDDLAHGKIAPETAIEFKYDRKSPVGATPFSMNAGELVNDFVRLRDFPDVVRYVVYLTDGEMPGHFGNPANGLLALLDPYRERTIPDDDMLAKKAKGFFDAAGDLTSPMRLRMRAHWDVGSGHALIVWQVWDAPEEAA